MKKNILLFCSVFLYCCSTCDSVKEHAKSLCYKFTITKKDIGKYIEFDGYDTSNKAVHFEEFEYWDIYSSVAIGDTLLKRKGETDLILIKKDTTLIFPLLCRGKTVE